MNYLRLDDMLRIRSQIATQYGEQIELVRHHGLMAALAAPRQSAFGQEAFPTLAGKAGALVYSLVQNHPFWDGNKRIASAALRLFLQRNHAELLASENEVKTFTRDIARGLIHHESLTTWLACHIKSS